MLRISNRKTRSIKMFSMLMAILMLFCCVDFSFIHAEGDEPSNTLNEWYVQATWNNDSTEYNLSSSKAENLYPKLTVRYYINQARRDYNAGDIVITIPGIGGVKRGSVLRATTTTTQSNSEWNMSYDSSKDVYTFTNKHSVPTGQIKSGGFEMMWELYSRDGENGYTESGSPTFLLKGGEETESITLPELKFSYTSERDKYVIDMSRSTITSSQFETVAQGKNDRIWYQYNTRFNVSTKARGVYKSDYFVKVSIYDDADKTQPTDIDYEQIEVYLSNGTRKKLTKIVDPETNKEVYGFYAFTNVNSVYTNTFYLGLPREIDGKDTELEGKQILVQSSFIALYNDEKEYVIQHRESGEVIKDEKLIDDSQGEINKYDFIYDGNAYSHSKSSMYDSNHVQVYSDRLLSNELYNSKVISYTLTASTQRNYSSGARARLRSNSRAAKAAGTTLSGDNPDFSADTEYQFIQGDDRVTVELASGAIRQLENDEYDFSYVTIPRENTTHNYTVYVSDDNTKPFSEYKVYKQGTTSSNESTTIQFNDEDVNAFYVAIEGVVGNYGNSIYVGIKFKLDWEKEQQKSASNRINPEGKITNFSYGRMVYTDSKGNSKNYVATDGNNYQGNYAQKLKTEDMENYGEYLYRWSCDVPLRTTVTNISSSTSSTKSSEVIQLKKNYGEGYIFNNTTGGTIQADESGELKKFSIYAVLQNNDMRVDENLKDIVCSDSQTLPGIKLSGSAVTTEGKTITDFSDYVSYEVRKTKDGQTVVVANFDFSNQPLEISKSTNIKMTFPIKISQNDYEKAISHTYNVNSYTIIHDKGISKIGGKSIMSDTLDIDMDGDLTEQIAYSSGVNNLEAIVREWEESADKFVKTYLTDDYVHSSRSKDVEALSWNGKSDSDKYKYSYKLNFNVGNAITEAVFYDNIERDEKVVSADKTITSDWYGTFLSVDTSPLQAIGITPTVYYSSQKHTMTSQNIIDDYKDTTVWTEMTQNGNIWTAPDDAEISSIAIHLDLGENNSISNRVLYAIVNMRTPKAVSEEYFGKKTYNMFSVAFRTIMGGDVTTRIFSSDFTEVMLSEEVPKLTLKKYDKQTKAAVAGAKFTIYTKDGENYTPISGLEDLEVGRTGQLVIDRGLKFEKDYYYRETSAPLGYKLDDNYYHFRFESTEETKTIEVPNTPLTGTLYFTKKDSDHEEYSDDTEKNITSLEGAEYSIYKYDGTRLFVNRVDSKDGVNIYEYSESGSLSEAVTGTNGFKITNIPWGSYYIMETAAPSGYNLDTKRLSFAIQKSSAKLGDSEIKASLSQGDSEKTASIQLTKTDSQNGDYLKGARFNLERLNKDGEWETVSDKNNISTNVMGELSISGIKFGTYRLKEINAPIGYELNENPYTESVVLDSTTIGKTFELKMQNDRKTGSASMTKYSEDGKTPLAGAKYDLYMVIGEIDSEENGEKNDQPIKYSLTTDTNGTTPTVSGLEWGKYYFVEVYAPKGYKKSSQKIDFEITAQDVDVRKDMTQADTKILGSVKLTKIAGDAVSPYMVGDKLPNVEFELYTKSGTQVKASYDSQSKTYSYDPNGSVSTFITDENGTITVNNLPWDSYYFEETKALSGFSLADKVRFTINASNCTSVQEIECENQKVQCSLKVTKQIDTSVEDFGTPTFLFKITKLDENGNKTSQSYTKSLIIRSGNSSSFTMLVDPGKYLIEEIKVARYNPKSVEIVEAETTTKVYSVDTSKNNATVTLATTDGEPDTASVKFTNELYRYDKVSHNSSATNIIAANRKITGISAEYTAGKIPLNKTASESTYTFGKSDISYKILYDDGSEEEITSADSRYANFTPESYTVSNGINDAGQIFQQNVAYTDSTTSRTYKAQFDVEVAALKVVESIKVIFKVDAENSCYFLLNGKRTTANVVYYNEDDDGNKISVSGEYITPTAIDEESYIFSGWVDADGNFIASSEGNLKEYLKNTDKTELTLYARVRGRSIVEDFDYTGEIQEFTAPTAGYYKLETWGASGGNGLLDNDIGYGGNGGYSVVEVYLLEGQTVYICVGGQGNDLSNFYTAADGGYNGGGNSKSNNDTVWGSGGGATHIALTKQGDGQLTNYENDNEDILVVAGGGGGGGITQKAAVNVGGAGGGSTGGDSTRISGVQKGWSYGLGKGGTQTAGGTTTTSYSGIVTSGTFGHGGNGQENTALGQIAGAGGGGGYYGGSTGFDYGGGGGGGSGYISTKSVNGKYISGETIIGTETFKSPNDVAYETGHSGNGHARISYIMMETFEYTGAVQEFVAPVDGYYNVECWGARGGDNVRTVSSTDIRKVYGGSGAYTQGLIKLTKGTTLYIYVGGKASDDTKSGQPGWNGGGEKKDTYTQALSGGGSTDIRLVKDTTSTNGWSDFDSLKSRIMVAAGGGGSAIAEQSYAINFGNGGNGGKLEGLVSDNAGSGAKTNYGTGGTQTSAGYTIRNKNQALGGFGYGGDASTIYYGGQSAGGGGGYYGGGGGYYCAPGGGGSSFISGYEGCDAITEDSTSNNIKHTGQSIHYSNMSFINGVMKAGNESMPNYNGSTMTGNRDNGYARITYIEQPKTQNFGYTGDVQTFTALQEGTYKLETWGASGGNGLVDNDIGYGGNGGYSVDEVYLLEGQTVYIGIGGRGNDLLNLNTTVNGGYNGGGKSKSNHDTVWGSGGGATHIALTKQGDGQLTNYENDNEDILVVAGGGGGGGITKNADVTTVNIGGAGGGSTGGNSTRVSGMPDWLGGFGKGGTQTAGGTTTTLYSGKIASGTFGRGGNGPENTVLNQFAGAGGGGGYYGGSAGFDYGGGGGGGSGHIGTGLTGKTIAGTEEFPSPDGTTEIGHTGNGYARITFVK